MTYTFVMGAEVFRAYNDLNARCLFGKTVKFLFRVLVR